MLTQQLFYSRFLNLDVNVNSLKNTKSAYHVKYLGIVRFGVGADGFPIPDSNRFASSLLYKQIVEMIS